MEPATDWVETVVPSTARLKVVGEPEAPEALIVTVVVPLTVAPSVGLVIDAVSGGVVEFETVTERVALAERPVASVTVNASVWVPLVMVVVSHGYVADVPLTT